MSSSTITVDVQLTDAEWSATMIEDCVAGFTSSPKVLSPVWFYDTRGSELFDAITQLPEYYPTRAERSLLETHAEDIVFAAAPDTLVELGSGTSDKTRLLLDAMAHHGSLDTYVPFDVSESTVRDAADRLAADYVGVEIRAVIGDFHRHLEEVPRAGRRLIAFLGGTIGNLAPEERARFLRDVRSTMDADDHLLLGVDLVKDPEILVAAYDDSAGVTAAFNRNALVHLNRRLDADFDPSGFDHVASWNDRASWIEMHLRSVRDQTVRLDALDMTIGFERGELLRTEISAKFSRCGLAAELGRAGFATTSTWCAEPGFLLVLAHPTR